MTFNTQNLGEMPITHNDPIHQMLVRRKQSGEDTQLPPQESFPQEDIDALEEFCEKYGILGFNFGKIHPRSALNMLKNKMGISSSNEVIDLKPKSLLKG